MTNFDGEEDERDPGESYFSQKVKKQGRHVRRKTMAQPRQHRPPPPGPSRAPLPPLSMHAPTESITEDIVFAHLSPVAEAGPSSPRSLPSVLSSPRSPQLASAELDHRRVFGAPPPPPSSQVDPRIQAIKLDTRVSVHSPLSPQYHSREHSPSPSVSSPRQGMSSPPPGPSQTYPPRPASHIQQQGHQRRLSARLSIAETLYNQSDEVMASPMSAISPNPLRSDASSIHGLMEPSEAHVATDRGGALDYLGNLSVREQADLGYVAALARPGRPKIDKILSSEVERASGRLVVACESALKAEYRTSLIVFWFQVAAQARWMLWFAKLCRTKSILLGCDEEISGAPSHFTTRNSLSEQVHDGQTDNETPRIY